MLAYRGRTRAQFPRGRGAIGVLALPTPLSLQCSGSVAPSRMKSLTRATLTPPKRMVKCVRQQKSLRGFQAVPSCRDVKLAQIRPLCILQPDCRDRDGYLQNTKTFEG